MFSQPDQEKEALPMLHPSVYLVTSVTMGVLTLLLVGIGVYPTYLIETIQRLLVDF